MQKSDSQFVKLYKEALRVAGVCLSASMRGRGDFPDERQVQTLAAALISGGLVAGARPVKPNRGADAALYGDE